VQFRAAIVNRLAGPLRLRFIFSVDRAQNQREPRLTGRQISRLDSPAMTPRRSIIIPWSIAAALLSTLVLWPVGSAAAGKAAGKGKPAAKAAKAKAAKAAAAKGKTEPSTKPSSPAATPYETPSPGQAETPPAAAGDTTKSADTSKPAESTEKPAETSTPPAEASATEAPKEPVPEAAPSEPSLPQETTIPPVVDSTPPSEPPPLYIEHLGPNAYPGRLRGIYGGSLWLEPTYHGLQFPYMTRSGVGVSGQVWVDSGYERVTRESMGDSSLFLQQGRAVLRVTPTYTNGSFFIQGQVEAVGNLCQVAGAVCSTQAAAYSTDDLWIRFGRWNGWDIKVGRFEGWELYHTGMGLDLYTLERQGASNFGVASPSGLVAPDFYGVNWMQYRPDAGLGKGYLAFHAYPSDSFRVEVLGEIGADGLGDTSMTYLGARPALILDQGWMKAKLGAEFERASGDLGYTDPNDITKKLSSKMARTRRGFGGALQFVIDPRAEFGANFAYGDQKLTPDRTSDAASDADSFTRISVGGFANLRLGALWLLGTGVHFTFQNDKHYAAGSQSPNYTANLQGFLAVQYLLARQLYIKAVVGYSRTDFVASDASIPVLANYMYNGRIRLMYLY
jgi:hypothetical protein